MAPRLMPRPSVPCPYVGGTLDLEANKARAVLELIQEQLAYDAPGTSVEFRLWASPKNQSPIWVGAFMHERGPLTVDNFAVYLTPMGEPRLYRSSYPGGSTAIGVVQVFSQAPAKLHVEIME